MESKPINGLGTIVMLFVAGGLCFTGHIPVGVTLIVAVVMREF